MGFYFSKLAKWLNIYDLFQRKIASKPPLVIKKSIQHYPSSYAKGYWIHAVDQSFDFKACNPNKFGKWILKCSSDVVDSNWEVIKKATEQGNLGLESKVSTLLRAPGHEDETHYVILVYTKDHQDSSDVFRVLDDIRKLNISLMEERVRYKTDIQTIETTNEKEEFLHDVPFAKLE